MALNVAKHTVASRGIFDLGFRHLGTTDFFRLKTLMCKELVAGDRFNVDLHQVITNAMNSAPINGKVNVHFDAFFVPMRSCWSKFPEYIAGTSQVTFPYMSYKTIMMNEILSARDMGMQVRRTLSDFGFNYQQSPIPLTSTSTLDFKISSLPFRALNRVYWDWFRDPLVTPDSAAQSYLVDTSGSDSVNDMVKLLCDKYRYMPHSYLSGCLHSPNGDPATMPILNNSRGVRSVAAVADYMGVAPDNQVPSGPEQINPENQLGGTTPNIQSIRAANAFQRFLEKCNVLGGRLRDRLMGMFGAKLSLDALNMSQYIKSTTTSINFKNSAQSAGFSGNAQSTYPTAFGSSNTNNALKGQLSGDTSLTECGISFDYSANEPGYLLVLQSIVPDVLYYQGIDRMFMRGISTHNHDRFDFYHEDMDGLGMQPLYLCEVVTPNTKMAEGGNFGSYSPLSVFGYQERYADYKYSHNILSGQFLEYGSFDNWHLGRDLLYEFGFTNADGTPRSGTSGGDIANQITRDSVGQSDILTRGNYDRKFVIQTSDYDHFVVDTKIDITASRPMADNPFPKIDNINGISTCHMGGAHL